MNSNGSRQRNFTAACFVFPACAFYCAFCLLPVAMSLWYSLFGYSAGAWRWAGGGNYVDLLADGRTVSDSEGHMLAVLAEHDTFERRARVVRPSLLPIHDYIPLARPLGCKAEARAVGAELGGIG